MNIEMEARWLHELRNAVNSSCIALDVARRALEAANPARALEFLRHAQRSCARMRDLLDMPDPGEFPV